MYLLKRCVYRYQRILLDPSKDCNNLKLFVFIASVYIAEIHFLLPKIPLLPGLTDFGQLYFSLTKKYSGINRLITTWYMYIPVGSMQHYTVVYYMYTVFDYMVLQYVHIWDSV